MNSELISVETKEEDEFVHAHIRSNFDNAHSFWTGLNNLEQHSMWTWLGTGNVASYLPWHPGQPDSTTSSRRECVVLYKNTDFSWHDIECTNTVARSVCEKAV